MDVCVKSGADPLLAHEAVVYMGLFTAHCPVPEFLGYRQFPENEGHVLVLRWVDGRAGAGRRAEDVRKMFAALGTWLAQWSSEVIDALRSGTKGADRSWQGSIPRPLAPTWERLVGSIHDAAWYREQLAGMVGRALRDPGLLGGLAVPEMLPLYGRVAAGADGLAGCAASAPLTIDPGDLTAENVVIRPDGGCSFLDFEYAALAPVTAALHNLNEPWDGAPQGSLADLALQVFFRAWKAASAGNMEWNDFRRSHYCCRAIKKLSELDHHIASVRRGELGADELTMARGYARGVPAVVAAALDAV